MEIGEEGREREAGVAMQMGSSPKGAARPPSSKRRKLEANAEVQISRKRKRRSPSPQPNSPVREVGVRTEVAASRGLHLQGRELREREREEEEERTEEMGRERWLDEENPERRSASGKATRTRPKPMPTEEEIEGFFAKAEEEQRRQFMDKYNFDVAKDAPQRGRYEWFRLKP